MTIAAPSRGEADGSANVEFVTLVDPMDRVIGKAEKLEAHRKGLLHRAFSVMIVDAEGRFLLQRRHSNKYHSGGLWSNTVCGHPRPSEVLSQAAGRRLYEEMGITSELKHQFEFVYKAEVAHGLVEYEYDHVFLGRYDGEPTPNTTEVEEWRWSAPHDVAVDLAEHPNAYTSWFRILFSRLTASDTLGLIG